MRTMSLRSMGPLTRTLTAMIAALLLAVAGWGGYRLLGPHPSCDAGVTKRGPDHECTGVTDGHFAFADPLKDVSALIYQENRRVENLPHVTIAMMVPMIPTDHAGQQQVLHEVQGAYLAQYRANRGPDARPPAIRLLLANPGRASAAWRPVADQLVAMAHSKGTSLRAVIGFDVSVRETEQTIAHLTQDEHIPVVAGPMTADDIANSPKESEKYPGLARVVATNTEQAKALFYQQHANVHESLVVEDERHGDNYIDSLKKVYEGYLRGAPLEPQSYTSPTDVTSEGFTSNIFRQTVDRICESPVKTIYFAGRPLQLRQFIRELGLRGCTDNKYTIVSGSGASTLADYDGLDWGALEKGITVEYTADAHPDSWKSKTAPATGGSAADVKELTDLAAKVFPNGETSFADSRSITEYDSAWTAIIGIRDTTEGDGKIPSLDQVAQEWSQLNGPDKILSAGGWICLDRDGNPYDKAVSVVRLNSHGKSHSVTFIRLAWPTGKAPSANCVRPASP